MLNRRKLLKTIAFAASAMMLPLTFTRKPDEWWAEPDMGVRIDHLLEPGYNFEATWWEGKITVYGFGETK